MSSLLNAASETLLERSDAEVKQQAVTEERLILNFWKALYQNSNEGMPRFLIKPHNRQGSGAQMRRR